MSQGPQVRCRGICKKLKLHEIFTFRYIFLWDHICNFYFNDFISLLYVLKYFFWVISCAITFASQQVIILTFGWYIELGGEIYDLDNMIDFLDLTDIGRTFHPN